MPESEPNGPPPNYVSSQPQILVAPRPDAASFFWGRTVQGEVFVKGLGQARGLQYLCVLPLTRHFGYSCHLFRSVRLHLFNTLPNHSSIPLHVFPSVTLYPPAGSISSFISDGYDNASFPPVHRFSIPLPPDSLMPGTLDLASSNRGQIRWYLTVRLALQSGQVIEDVVQVEGTPPELGPSEGVVEVEEVLQRDGVRARLLLDTNQPRLGSLLRLGLEVRAMEREKTRVAGLSAQPNPTQTLRPLRRVRVELFRRVRILTPSSAASSSSTSPAPEDQKQHLTLLYASGKSLRYPGMNPVHPPLRVLFTIPTTQLGSVAEQSWGEITMATIYHDVRFFVRVSIGFDGPDSDWVLEKSIHIRPKLWKEPRQVVNPREQRLILGADETGMVTDEEAFRLKGQDMVGANGTIRGGSQTSGEDLPPPFEGEGSAGPSRGGLPTFLESEAQMQAGEVSNPVETVASQQQVRGAIELDESGSTDRSTTVGRTGSLAGELGTWVEVRLLRPLSPSRADGTSTTGTRPFLFSLLRSEYHLARAAAWIHPRRATMTTVSLLGLFVGSMDWH